MELMGRIPGAVRTQGLRYLYDAHVYIFYRSYKDPAMAPDALRNTRLNVVGSWEISTQALVCTGS